MMDFDKALSEVVDGILQRADEERQKSEPYKNLWEASEKNLTSLLSEACHQMDFVVIDTLEVIKKRFNISRISDEVYNLIKLLPFAMSILRENIKDKEGHSCCADKALEIYCQKLLEEIKKCC